MRSLLGLLDGARELDDTLRPSETHSVVLTPTDDLKWTRHPHPPLSIIRADDGVL